ncbi:hypothetical protein [Ferruginibacter sp.]|nr:hypothetical protein [Ferruginibacter sp.]
MWDNLFYFTVNNPPTQNSWFKDYGSIIGNVITILLFIIAFYKDKAKNRKKEEKTKTEKLKYLASLVNGSIKSAKLNKDNIQETSNAFKSEPALFHLIKINTYYDIKRVVEKLNLEEYYLAYVTHFEKRKNTTIEFQKIITCLDTLFDMFNEIIKQAERASINDFDRKKVLNGLGDEVHNLIEKILHLVEDSKMPQSFKSLLKQPIEKWSKEKNKTNIQLFFDILCVPLYNIVSDFHSQNQLHTPLDFILLLERLKTIKIEFDFIKSGNIIYSESLEMQIGEIDKTIGTLEINSKDLREYLEKSDSTSK